MGRPDREPADSDGRPAAGDPGRLIPGPPVVALATSTGGLDAVEAFFRPIRRNTGLAFVIAHHLAPEFNSLLAELLGRQTGLPIIHAEDGTLLESDAIHLLAPERATWIDGDRIRVTDAVTPTHGRTIDFLLDSLAQERGPTAMAAVLSGSGADGARGALAIHDGGGLVLVQEPESARFASMPLEAIAVGCGDRVMLAEAMLPVILSEQARRDHPGETAPALAEAARPFTPEEGGEARPGPAALLEPISLLEDDAVIACLEDKVLPALRHAVALDRGLRIWVPDCGSGGDAYGLALLLAQGGIGLVEGRTAVIHATDPDEAMLAAAGRAGLDGKRLGGRARRMVERLRRERPAALAGAELRRLIAFARHDLLSDPPLRDLDLIACRGLVDRYGPAIAEDVLQLFRGALKPRGLLLLGPGDTAGLSVEGFQRLDQDLCLLRKAAKAAAGGWVGTAPAEPEPMAGPGGRRREPSLTAAYETLIAAYAPPSLLIDKAGAVVHIFGEAAPYLKATQTDASLAIDGMVRDELRRPLMRALERARATAAATVSDPVNLEPAEAGGAGAAAACRVRLRPLGAGTTAFMLVSFEAETAPATGPAEEPS